LSLFLIGEALLFMNISYINSSWQLKEYKVKHHFKESLDSNLILNKPINPKTVGFHQRNLFPINTFKKHSTLQITSNEKADVIVLPPIYLHRRRCYLVEDYLFQYLPHQITSKLKDSEKVELARVSEVNVLTDSIFQIIEELKQYKDKTFITTEYYLSNYTNFQEYTLEIKKNLLSLKPQLRYKLLHNFNPAHVCDMISHRRDEHKTIYLKFVNLYKSCESSGWEVAFEEISSLEESKRKFKESIFPSKIDWSGIKRD